MVYYMYRIDHFGIQLQRISAMFLQSRKNDQQGRVVRFESETGMRYAIVCTSGDYYSRALNAEMLSL